MPAPAEPRPGQVRELTRAECFELLADGTGEAARTGWSVIVRGEITEVTDPAELVRLHGLPLRPWAPGARDRYVRILPAGLTGRRITAG